jgi:hypothetical protein
LNVATGEVIAKTTKQHRAKEFVTFLQSNRSGGSLRDQIEAGSLRA